jgi:hypothetical protein
MTATIFKGLSDAPEYRHYEAGEVIDGDIVLLVNGKEIATPYSVKEDDIIVIRELPGDAGLGFAILWMVIGGAILIGGAAIHDMNLQQKRLEEQLAASAQEDNRLPFLRDSSNTLATGKTQPFIFGQHYLTPNKLCSPFYKIDGTDGANQYFYCLYELGYAQQIIEKVLVDDVEVLTLAQTAPQTGQFALTGLFPGTVEFAQTGAALATLTELNSKVVSEYSGKKIPYYSDEDDLVFTLDEYAMDVTIVIAFPSGLYSVSSDYGQQSATIVYTPQYSLDNGTNWVDFAFSPSNTFTKNETKELRYSAYNAFTLAQATGAYPILVRVHTTNEEPTSGVTSASVLYVQSKIYDPDLSTSSLVACEVVKERERLKSTIMALKIKATDSNENKLGKVHVITHGVARTWNGSAWTTGKTKTRNPAAWALELLTTSTHGASKFDDAEIDLPSFGAWYTFCATNGFYYDKVLTSALTKENALNSILEAGRAMKYINVGGKISIAYDAEKVNPIALLNSQNIISTEVKKDFSRSVDGLQVEFIGHETQQEESYIIMKDETTQTADSIIRTLKLDGIEDYDHVVKHARYLMACDTLRRRSVTVRVGQEGIYYTPLSKVLLSSQTIRIGLGHAEIKRVIVEGAYITQLELYEPITLSPDDYAITVNCIDDTYCTPLTMLIDSTAYTERVTTITLSSPLAVISAAIPHAGDVLSYGLVDEVTTEFLIASIEPDNDGFTLELVEYNTAIYDAGTIPTYTPIISRRPAIVEKPEPVIVTPADIAQTVAGSLTVTITNIAETSASYKNGIYGVYRGAWYRWTASTSTTGFWTYTDVTPITDSWANYTGLEIPELPDNVAGTTYLQTEWTTVDGWVAGGDASLTVQDGYIRATETNVSPHGLYRTIAGSANKLVVLKIRSSSVNTFIVTNNSGTQLYAEKSIGTDWEYFIFVKSTATNDNTMYMYERGPVGSYFDIAAIYIGTGAYDTLVFDNSYHHRHLINNAVIPTPQGFYFNGTTSYLRSRDKVTLPDVFTFRATVNCAIKSTAHTLFNYQTATPANGLIWIYIISDSRNIILAYYNTNISGLSYLVVGYNGIDENTDTVIETEVNFINKTANFSKNNSYVGQISLPFMQKPSETTFFTIGQHFYAGASAFLGYMKDVSLHDVELTDANRNWLAQGNKVPSIYSMVDYVQEQFDDDGIISANEKPAILSSWLSIYALNPASSALTTTSTTKDGDYSVLVAEALSAGLTASTGQVVDYVAKTNAIRDYCFNSITGVLLNMKVSTSVTAGSWDTLKAQYSTAKEALRTAITQAVGTITPNYLGAATALPSSYTIGDFFVVKTAFSTYEKGKIYYWSGSAWIVDSDYTSERYSKAMIDLLDIAAGTGEEKFFSRLVACDGFIDRLAARVIRLQEGGVIKSQNFLSGVRGFQIGYDGNAEFNNGTFNGMLNAKGLRIYGFTAGDIELLTIKYLIRGGAVTITATKYTCVGTGQFRFKISMKDGSAQGSATTTYIVKVNDSVILSETHPKDGTVYTSSFDYFVFFGDVITVTMVDAGGRVSNALLLCKLCTSEQNEIMSLLSQPEDVM